MFGIIDSIVFFSLLFLSFCIGIFFAFWERKRNTIVDYFLAGRKSKVIPVALSLVVSFQSSILMIGIPAEAYVYGVGLSYYAIGITVAYLFAAFVIVPVFHPLKLISVNEYFTLRYGNNTLRYMCFASGIVYSLFYMAAVTVGTCFALNVVIGLPAWGTILIYTVVTTVYTSFGGIKAVIWTDVFQLVIMVIGLIAILVKSSLDIGGSQKVFKYAKDRFDSTDFRFDPTVRYQFWNVSFGTITTMVYITFTQPAMQRIYSVPNVKAARILYIIATPIYSCTIVTAVFVGVTLFAYFSGTGCDIYEAGIVDNLNAIVPFGVLQLFRKQPGLPGLFTASLSSAALSTLSSCLSSLSAITFQDVIKVQFPNIKSYQAIRISKMFVVIYGIIAMGISFALLHLPGAIIVIFVSLMSCIDGPMCAVFVLSLMHRGATTKGLSIGLLCGVTLALWLNIGSHFSDVTPYHYLPSGPTDKCDMYGNITTTDTLDDNVSMGNTTLISTDTFNFSSNAVSTSFPTSPLYTMYSISYILYSLIAFTTTTLIGLVISLFTDKPQVFDERCLFSFRRHVLEELFKGHKNERDITKVNVAEEGTSFLSRESAF